MMRVTLLSFSCPYTICEWDRSEDIIIHHDVWMLQLGLRAPIGLTHLSLTLPPHLASHPTTPTTPRAGEGGRQRGQWGRGGGVNFGEVRVRMRHKRLNKGKITRIKKNDGSEHRSGWKRNGRGESTGELREEIVKMWEGKSRGTAYWWKIEGGARVPAEWTRINRKYVTWEREKGE